MVDSWSPALACRISVDDLPGFDRRVAEGVVAAVVALASDRASASVALDVYELILRDAARRAGFAGPLRGPLVAAVDVVASRPAAEAPAERTLAAVIEALVPSVGVATNRSRLRGILRSSMFGLSASGELAISLGARHRPLRVVAPDEPDLLPEGVALAIDTVRDVDARFAPWIAHIRVVSFDYSDHGMRTGRIGGQAHQQAAIVHLNASYVLAGALQTMRADRPAREPHPAQWSPVRATVIDAVTAHELWHHIEFAFEARDYRRSIAFRRRLGEQLGVETIEHAVRGSVRGAPLEWQRAHQRLASEVSAYATTNAREATAEMFLQAWCYATRSPMVEHFARTVDEFLPPASPGGRLLSTPPGTSR